MCTGTERATVMAVMVLRISIRDVCLGCVGALRGRIPCNRRRGPEHVHGGHDCYTRKGYGLVSFVVFAGDLVVWRPRRSGRERFAGAGVKNEVIASWFF